MLKIWKLRLRMVTGVNDTLVHIPLGKSFSTKDFRERETLKLVPRDPSLVNATNNINVLNLVLHICLRNSLRLAHTAYFNWSLRTSYRTLIASLSSKFLFGDVNSGRGNSSSNNWRSVRLGRTNVFKQDDALLWYASRFNSKKVANRLLQCGFIISFMKFVISLIFTMTVLSATNYVIKILSWTHWGKKLKFPHFKFSFLDLFKILQLQLYCQLLDFSN